MRDSGFRTGPFNERDLLIFFKRTDGSWSDPISLKDRLSLKGTDLLGGCLSPDGKYLFLLDDMDIYWVKAGVIDDLRIDALPGSPGKRH